MHGHLTILIFQKLNILTYEIIFVALNGNKIIVQMVGKQIYGFDNIACKD